MNASRSTLDRFVLAQERDYDRALFELRAGRKQTHWIWYVLPQLRSLGRSQMAKEYGITNLDEARGYAKHPVLGPRLVECVNAMLAHSSQTAEEILGDIDAQKFKSCLTLFAEADPSEPCFTAALRRFYNSKPDIETLRMLALES